MKFKKMLSLMAATAIAASSFAAMAVTASAADSVTYTWDFTDSTWFTATYNAGSSITSQEGTESSPILSNPGAKFSLNTSSVSGYQVVKTEATVTNAMQIVVPAGGSASLSIQLTTGSAGKELYIKDANSTAVLTAGDYTKNVLKEYTVALTPGATYTLDTSNYKAYIGKVSLTVTASSGGGEPVVDTKYAITVADGIENGSVLINGGLTEAAAGATVNVTATPAEGYVLDSITVNGTAIAGKSFTMPSEAVEVSATFTEYVASVKVPMPKGATVVFDDYVGNIADGAIVADYILVNDKNAKVAVDNNNKTVDEVAYKSRIKSGGNTAVYTITPKAGGTLKVLALSANANDARAFAVNGEEATAPASASGVVPEWFSFDVKGGTDITITFPGGGVNIYCIKLVEASPAPEVEVSSTVDEKAAFTTEGGYDKNMVVGKITVTVKNGSYDLKNATYYQEKGDVTDINGNPVDTTTITGDANGANVLVFVVIENETDTDALSNVTFE